MNPIIEFFRIFLYIPIANVLIYFYVTLGSNLGLAILALTALLRLLLIPSTLKSFSISAKQKELAPEVEKLKKKYGDNKTLFAQKQMELYKEHGFNPMAGCLPQLPQLIVVIVLYQVLLDLFRRDPSYFNSIVYWPFLKFSEGVTFNTNFFYLDLSQKDPYYALPVLAGLAQLLLSKISMPQAKKMEKLAEKTPDSKDDIMYNMQSQMIYTLPVITVIFGITLPSGLVLYWFASTLFILIQQWLLSKRQLKK